MKKFLFAAIIASLIAGCCPCKKYQKKYGKPFVGTEWTMIQFEGRAFTASEGYKITFAKDDKLSGIGDCNRLIGSYKEDKDGALQIKGLASTRMMCPNLQGETQFSQMLESVDSYQLDGKLMMVFKKGEMLAVFEAK